MQSPETRRLAALMLALALAPSCGRPTDLPDERQPKALADLYVAPPERGGDDANPGNRSNAPLATLGRALALAAAMDRGEDAVQVAIAQGLYGESLSVPAGLNVALNGGYDGSDPPLWTRPGTAASTLIVSPAGPAVLVPEGATLALSRIAAYGGPGAVEGLLMSHELLPSDLNGAGAVVVLGGSAFLSQSLAHGGAGAMGEARAGLYAAQGATVVTDLSSLEAGDGSSFPVGLYCGYDSDCEARRCPLIGGGVAERRALPNQSNQSSGVGAIGSTRLVLTDNEQILGREGSYSTGIWTLATEELAVSGNELIRSGSALQGSFGVMVNLPEGPITIEGNATIEGGASDASTGVFVQKGSPTIRNNHFIQGGDARMSSYGLTLLNCEDAVVESNEGIVGGSGFQTVGLLMSNSTARVRANSIDGGKAVYDSVGTQVVGVSGDTDAVESQILANTIFAGIAGERSVGMLINGASSVVLNNAVLVGGGLRENQGLLLYDNANPLVAFNTIAAISQLNDLAPPAHAVAVRDLGSSATVTGNLAVLNRWEHGSLLWFPMGRDEHGRYSKNAWYHWDTGDIVPGHPEVSELLLVGEVEADPPDPDTIAYPDAGNVQDAMDSLNALTDIDDSFTCFPGWRLLSGQGFGIGFDVHLTILSGCRGKGPDYSAISVELAARGLTMTADDLKDYDGEPRPMGSANEPGADELTE